RRDEPKAALEAIGCDAWTAIAIATHNIDTDREALAAALPSQAGYVGLLGARKRLPERLAPLRAAGVPEATLMRVHAPIGLDIGGKAPWEVAVSVIGEIMALRSAKAPATPREAPSRRDKVEAG
ncbi:MAG TPA: XdhC family protein, partial [Phenylobacterium sp.]|nr:XdhC family protein [Phenylobacterium sp.]